MMLKRRNQEKSISFSAAALRRGYFYYRKKSRLNGRTVENQVDYARLHDYYIRQNSREFPLVFHPRRLIGKLCPTFFPFVH